MLYSYCEGMAVKKYILIEPCDPNDRKASAKWHVLCFCNNKFISTPNQLLNKKSCGCIRKTGKGSTKKYNYINYKNNANVELIEPIEKTKNGPKDKWIAICNQPYANHPKKFITTPNNVISETTKSCGCLAIEKNKQRFRKYRIEHGYLPDELMATENVAFRNKFFKPIQQLILKIDNYTCNLCLKEKTGKLHVHHIVPINENKNKIIELSNLITLCDNCHLYDAHNGCFNDINCETQDFLLLLTETRFIEKIYLEEYENIIKDL